MDGPRRLVTHLAVLAVVALPLAGCSGSDGGLLPAPTRTPTISPTRSVTATPTRSPRPTPTPAPSESPTESPTEPPSETPTETPSPTETPEPTRTPEPTPTETVTVTESPSEEPSPTETPTPTPTGTPTPSPSPTASETPDAGDESVDEEEDLAPTWVWILIGLVLLAVAIGIPLYLWLGRRKGWRAELAAAEAELAWLAGTHLPELRGKAGSPDRVSGGWEVGGEGRASAAEDHLTQLEASAPNDEAAARARTLRDGVRSARLRLSGLEGVATPEGVTASLDAAIADLEAALGTAPPA